VVSALNLFGVIRPFLEVLYKSFYKERSKNIMLTPHAIKRIEERRINIDLEMLEYLSKKYSDKDTAVILGEVYFLDAENYVIALIRGGNVVTIEFRRKSQTITEKSLNVECLVKYPCLF